MKENGINKLIELLNEYEKVKTNLSFRPNFWKTYKGHLSFLEYNSKYSELLFISKGYGFIKRLVDEDKIERYLDKYALVYNENSEYKPLKWDEELIMLLSIQENPVEFLISILK